MYPSRAVKIASAFVVAFVVAAAVVVVLIREGKLFTFILFLRN